MMKKFVVPVLKAIAIELLSIKKNEPLFSIKCLRCGHTREIESGYYQGSGDIEIVSEKDIYTTDQLIVSISCSKCGNNLTSSES